MNRALVPLVIALLCAGGWFWLRSSRLQPGPAAVAPASRPLSPRSPARDADLRTPAAQPARPLDAPPAASTLAPQTQDEPALEEWAPEDLPADPVESGPAALDLRLVHEDSREPLASAVELWRLDAPGNTHWSAGAQLQARADVPLEGWVFARLPEGRYRIVCDALLADEDPPVVEVLAPITRLDLALAPARSLRVLVEVRDERGLSVQELQADLTHSVHVAPAAPWREERRLLDGDSVFDSVSWESREPSAPWQPLDAGPQGEFDLGVFTERRRGDGGRFEVLLRTAAGAEVRVPIPQRGSGELRFVAVALDPQVVRDSARLADERGLVLDEVEVRCTALPRLDEQPEGGWRRVPVRVRVSAQGLSGGDLTWRPEQGPFPLLRLRR